MPIVTALQPERGRVQIIIDGRPAASTHRAAVKMLGITEGQEIDPIALRDRIHRAERELAQAMALDLLAKRARSIVEIRRRLASRGFTPEIIDPLIDRLAATGLLDDERLAHEYVEARLESRPSGRRLLRAEMARRGIGREAAEKALGAAPISGSPEELDLARRAARERLSRCATVLDEIGLQKEHRRLVAFLLRRGFSYEVAERAARESMRSRSTERDSGPRRE